MAAMLRSQGIPARAASGYAEGTLDPEIGTYRITERDAHTWVEVYFPQYGWLEFEPTAGESILDRPSGAELQDSGLIPGMDDIMPEDGEFLFDDAFDFEEEFPQDIAGPVTGIGGLPTRSPLILTSVAPGRSDTACGGMASAPAHVSGSQNLYAGTADLL